MSDLLSDTAGICQAPIIEIDPDECEPFDGNRVVRESDCQDLAEDFERNGGQLQPGIVARHPTKPDKKVIVAGVRRWMACKLTKRKFRAAFLDRVPTREELIRLGLAENIKRKALRAFELCSSIDAYMREMPPATTWAQVGEMLGLTPSTLSRLLAPKRIPAALRQECDGLCATAIQIIGGLPTVAMMKEAIDYAKGDGTPRTKEEIERFSKKLKHGNKRGRKPKGFTVKEQGCEMSFKPRAGMTPEQIAAWLEAVAARIKKNRALGSGVIPFLFSKEDQEDDGFGVPALV